MSEQTKTFINKEEIVHTLEIMYSIKSGTSEFGKCSVAFLEKLYYGNIQNAMRTNELATKEAAQRTIIMELESKVDSLNKKINRQNRGAKK